MLIELHVVPGGMEIVRNFSMELFQPGNDIFIRFENDRFPSCTPFVHKTYLWDTRLNRMGDRRLLHSCCELQLGCSLEDVLIQLFDSYHNEVLVLEQF